MKEIQIGKKKYKIQFGYKVVSKYGVVKKLMEIQGVFSDGDKDFADGIEAIMENTAELLLAGLQKHHSDTFGFDIETGDGKKEAKDKVYDLLDSYFESDDADPVSLIGDISEELEKNGFLSKIMTQVAELTADE